MTNADGTTASFDDRRCAGWCATWSQKQARSGWSCRGEDGSEVRVRRPSARRDGWSSLNEVSGEGCYCRGLER